MAITPSSSGVDMKGFYRQKKKSGISKKTTNKSVSQTPLISPRLHDDVDNREEMLKQFDMNMAYGPCIGMTRLARFERAQRLGLNPPNQIEVLLKHENLPNLCLWDGRV